MNWTDYSFYEMEFTESGEADTSVGDYCRILKDALLDATDRICGWEKPS